jgi:hypothetical protein
MIRMSTAALLTRAALVLGVTTVGCQSSTAPPWGVEVVTQGTVFERGSAGRPPSVPFAVFNRGQPTLYLDACGGQVVAVVDVWEDSRWSQYGGGICLASVSMISVELPPGASHASQTAISEPGIYRLRVGVAQDPGATARWAVTASSNPFQIR